MKKKHLSRNLYFLFTRKSFHMFHRHKDGYIGRTQYLSKLLLMMQRLWLPSIGDGRVIRNTLGLGWLGCPGWWSLAKCGWPVLNRSQTTWGPVLYLFQRCKPLPAWWLVKVFSIIPYWCRMFTVYPILFRVAFYNGQELNASRVFFQTPSTHQGMFSVM